MQHHTYTYQLVVHAANARPRILRFSSRRAAFSDFRYYSQLGALGSQKIIKLQLVGDGNLLKEKITEQNS
jgi:hypothetical protein